MSLALVCDVRWASEKARFGQSFVKIGLHPDWGSVHALPRLIGQARALELMWTGDLIDAAEAQRIGLVTRVLPEADLLPKTIDFAARLADGPAVAEAQKRCWNTRDAREGITAFLEKRQPRYEGR